MAGLGWGVEKVGQEPGWWLWGGEGADWGSGLGRRGPDGSRGCWKAGRALGVRQGGAPKGGVTEDLEW